MTKNGHIHGFSELYSCIYLCKIAVLLAVQGIEGGMFLYMDMYMQSVYAFVRGYVDECGMWF